MESAVIEIFTNEAAHYHGSPVDHAVVQYLRSRRIAARVHVYRGITGVYESGGYNTINILDISDNLPIKIEILLPAPELDRVLAHLSEIVTEGAIAVRSVDVRYHRSQRGLLPRDLRVSDIMTVNPVCVNPETPLPEVVRILMDASFRGLPVVDADEHVVGIVTEEDLVTRAKLPVRPDLLGHLGTDLDLANPTFSHVAELKTADVMTAPADMIDGSAFVHQAAQRLVAHRHRTLPVVDPTGRLVGMCSPLDVLRAAGHWNQSLEGWDGTRLELTDASTVRDAVTDRDRHVGPEATVLDVGRIIAESGMRRVAVVDADSKVVGIVAETDVLKALEPQKSTLIAYLTRHLSSARTQSQSAKPIKVSAVMTRNPVTITETETLGLATTMMAEHHLKELPVVDADGRFVGFLSRRTLMRAMVTGQAKNRPSSR